MHILHVIDSLAPGGSERMLVDIANATAARGLRVSACVTRRRTDLADELRPDVELLVLGRHRRFELAPLRRLATHVRRREVDLLHVHGRSTSSLVGLLKVLGALPVPMVMHDHYGSIEYDVAVPLWFRLWGRRAASQYAGVCDELTRWAIQAGVPVERARTIENALDLDRMAQAAPTDLRSEFGVPGEHLLGLVVCGLRHDKGVDLLLAAFAACRGRQTAHLAIAGGSRDDAYTALCRRRTEELGLAGAVSFLGERDDVPGLVRGADFAVVPSRSESGPLVLIEYLAAGLPFVATRTGAVARRLEELEVPGIVEPGNVRKLAAELDRLLATPADALRARGEAGRAVAHRHFDVHRTLDLWLEVYELALRAGRPTYTR